MCQGGEPDIASRSLTLVNFSIILNVCCSACENGCVVDGTCATAANISSNGHVRPIKHRTVITDWSVCTYNTPTIR